MVFIAFNACLLHLYQHQSKGPVGFAPRTLPHDGIKLMGCQQDLLAMGVRVR